MIIMKLVPRQSAILRIYSTKTADFCCGNYVVRKKKGPESHYGDISKLFPAKV
jgi:hypothetical protein